MDISSFLFVLLTAVSYQNRETCVYARSLKNFVKMIHDPLASSNKLPSVIHSKQEIIIPEKSDSADAYINLKPDDHAKSNDTYATQKDFNGTPDDESEKLEDLSDIPDDISDTPDDTSDTLDSTRIIPRDAETRSIMVYNIYVNTSDTTDNTSTTSHDTGVTPHNSSVTTQYTTTTGAPDDISVKPGTSIVPDDDATSNSSTTSTDVPSTTPTEDSSFNDEQQSPFNIRTTLPSTVSNILTNFQNFYSESITLRYTDRYEHEPMQIDFDDLQLNLTFDDLSSKLRINITESVIVDRIVCDFKRELKILMSISNGIRLRANIRIPINSTYQSSINYTFTFNHITITHRINSDFKHDFDIIYGDFNIAMSGSYNNEPIAIKALEVLTKRIKTSFNTKLTDAITKSLCISNHYKKIYYDCITPQDIIKHHYPLIETDSREYHFPIINVSVSSPELMNLTFHQINVHGLLNFDTLNITKTENQPVFQLDSKNLDGYVKWSFDSEFGPIHGDVLRFQIDRTSLSGKLLESSDREAFVIEKFALLGVNNNDLVKFAGSIIARKVESVIQSSVLQSLREEY